MIVSIISPNLDITHNSPDYPLADCTGCKSVGTIFQKSRDWDKSYFIRSLPKAMVESILQGKVCAYSFHKKCIPISFMNHPALCDFRWVASSLENDNNGPMEFLGIFENVTLGWFGVQCHPEKVAVFPKY